MCRATLEWKHPHTRKRQSHGDNLGLHLITCCPTFARATRYDPPGKPHNIQGKRPHITFAAKDSTSL